MDTTLTYCILLKVFFNKVLKNKTLKFCQKIQQKSLRKLKNLIRLTRLKKFGIF